jgi:hypothetical protein
MNLISLKWFPFLNSNNSIFNFFFFSIIYQYIEENETKQNKNKYENYANLYILGIRRVRI